MYYSSQSTDLMGIQYSNYPHTVCSYCHKIYMKWNCKQYMDIGIICITDRIHQHMCQSDTPERKSKYKNCNNILLHIEYSCLQSWSKFGKELSYTEHICKLNYQHRTRQDRRSCNDQWTRLDNKQKYN